METTETITIIDVKEKMPMPDFGEYGVHPYAELFPLLPDDELAALAEDIAEKGLEDPIWLTADGQILDGRNRYLACAHAGVTPDFRVYDGDDPLGKVVSLNLKRRHLTESQRAMVASRIATLRVGQRADRHDGSEGVDAQICASTQNEAAQLLNVSRMSVQNARKVQEQGVPELAERVMAGKASVSAAALLAEAPAEEQRRVIALDDEKAVIQAAKDIKRRKQEEARARVPEPVSAPVPVPSGKYQCVVMDPPWPMKKIEREERPDQGVELDYPTMPVWCQSKTDPFSTTGDGVAPCFRSLPHRAEVADGSVHARPCKSIECVIGEVLDNAAMDDCHIYVWVTHKYLPDGLKLLESWGFKYQCLMTWRKNVGITPFSWMYDTEHVLFGRRGSLKLDRLGLRLSFEAPVRGHSVKPDVFYERVIEASPGPRLELFSRAGREGFTPWGNEVDADVV